MPHDDIIIEIVGDDDLIIEVAGDDALIIELIERGPEGPPGFSDRNVSRNETPTGDRNGINVFFAIAHTAIGGITLSLNGLTMSPGAGNDYTLSGTTITFQSGQTPQAGDTILTTYSY